MGHPVRSIRRDHAMSIQRAAFEALLSGIQSMI
jgi:hypothetical protein